MTTEGVLYFMVNALESRQLHKMYNFIFKCPEPKQKLYCFIFMFLRDEGDMRVKVNSAFASMFLRR